MIGIYMIKNKANDKVYIGRSKDITSRFSSHKHNLINKKHINNYLQQSWNKYGEENFEFIILEECDSVEETYEREIFYINKFNSTNMNYGYNLSSGGEGAGNWSEESKEKLSISKRFNNTSLMDSDVRLIKLFMYCNMDRKEISKIFSVSRKVLTQISRGKSFEYISPELNKSIHNLKQKMIDERNHQILKLFDDGNKIVDIVRSMDLSTSIVEKCVYRYRNAQDKNINKYKKIYDEVFRLYNEGYKKYKISKILKISPSTVDRYLNGTNNPYKELKYKKITNEKKEIIIDMFFNKNYEVKNIAKKLQVSRNTIETYVNNYKYANTEVTNLSNID